MPVTIRLPAALRALAESKKQVEVEATTVAEALTALGKQFPKLAPSLPGTSPKRFVQVFLNDEDVRGLDGLDTKLSPKDVIELVSAVAGG